MIGVLYRVESLIEDVFVDAGVPNLECYCPLGFYES